MGKKHFTEEQIAYALRQQEAGTPVLELTRKLGVSEQTFYRWKRKFARRPASTRLHRMTIFPEEQRWTGRKVFCSSSSKASRHVGSRDGDSAYTFCSR